MIELNHKNLFLTVPLIIFLAACAAPARDSESANNKSTSSTLNPVTEYSVTQNYNLDVIDYTVKRGDQLSTIAEDITGRSSNWRAIAEFNSIGNPNYLQAGTVLAIPTELIVGYERSTNVLVSQSDQTTPTTEAQSSSLALRRNDAVEVIVTPINTNRDFELNPIDPNAPKPTQSYRGEGTKVKVIGSYYPKGIYIEPAAYSKLIQRAAPGTLFVLDSQVNDWYKIETNSGSGYIRTSDAVIVKKNE